MRPNDASAIAPDQRLMPRTAFTAEIGFWTAARLQRGDAPMAKPAANDSEPEENR